MKKLNIILLFLLFFTTFTFSQQTVEGIISDSSGETLAGASINEKGTLNGTVADFNGNYKITAKTGATLVFSYVGYQTKEILISTPILNVTLESGEQLNEVQIVGSRSTKRTVIDSAIPVDVIDVAELATKNGNVEINQLLQYGAPSFNASKQSGSDGATILYLHH